ncbi:MAG: hypothetical protein LBV74_00125 [Tannerella sp.]|jgi:hypothetical protein|nr:hypothetical protein [Tannerella sp.]
MENEILELLSTYPETFKGKYIIKDEDGVLDVSNRAKGTVFCPVPENWEDYIDYMVAALEKGVIPDELADFL